MNWREIFSRYLECFGESAGVPFEGFPDEKTEREFFETLEVCLAERKPLAQEQRNRFFPLEFEDVPSDTAY
jgi:hypothetical protein